MTDGDYMEYQKYIEYVEKCEEKKCAHCVYYHSPCIPSFEEDGMEE